jgi:hypothetical protein
MGLNPRSHLKYVQKLFATKPMTQPNSENNVLENYLKACGFGLNSPDRAVRPPIKLTGDPVRDYIAIAGFGLKKP